MKKLYLDDERFPRTSGWEIVRSYKQFVKWIEENGVPSLISFDHDLGDISDGSPDWREHDGYDCAKWVCEYCLTNGIRIPKWNVHSANGVGRENIESVLKHYEREFSARQSTRPRVRITFIICTSCISSRQSKFSC